MQSLLVCVLKTPHSSHERFTSHSRSLCATAGGNGTKPFHHSRHRASYESRSSITKEESVFLPPGSCSGKVVQRYPSWSVGRKPQSSKV